MSSKDCKNLVQYNSPSPAGVDMPEAPQKEIERQKRNEREIDRIQNKHKPTDSESDNVKQQIQEMSGNILDASGHVHADSGENDGRSKSEKKGVFADHSNPLAKLWSNDPNDPFADQWRPTPLPKEQQVGRESHQQLHHHHDNLERRDSNKHRRLGEQPSAFNQTFESTMSELKTIFNTADDGAPLNDLHKSKLSNPTPLMPVQPDDLVKNLQIKALKYIIIACIISYLMGRYRVGYTLGGAVITACAWAYWNLGKVSSKGLKWQLERQENMKTLYTSEGESVEWLNYMVEKIWRSVDPEFFTVIEDLLEDTLQRVAPSFIVSDFDIGVQAPRIQMIRVFPPLPGQPEESIFGEASFSFHAYPVASLITHRSPRSTPPGLAIRFQTALKAPLLEVKGELIALSGKIRFKLLTSPEIPFISKATIAFTSIPQIETGVMPLTKHLNIMNFPTIKTLVDDGVKLGFADLIDPKSLTIDVQALMGAFSQDTSAIGVVKVEVREAHRDASLKLQDMKDSYATLSLRTQPKKSSSSTRVLTNDKNPRWNENLYVLVFKDDIVSESKVDVKVWDADKVKFDDMWGSVSMSVKDIVEGRLDKLGNVSSWCQDEKVVFDGWTPIDGKEEGKSKIKLNMKMSYHPKYPTANMSIFNKGSLKQKANFEKDKEHIKKRQDKDLEVPVDPNHTNGIISVTIHQAVDLEVGDLQVLRDNHRFKHPYNHSTVVSPYAILYINDNKVFRTRTKLRNPSPFKETQKWIPLANGIGFGKFLLSVKYKPVKLTLPKELQGSDVGTLIVERVSLSSLKAPLDVISIKSTKAVLSLNLDPVIIKRLKAKDISKQLSPEQKKAQEEEGSVFPDDQRPGPYGWYSKHLYFPLMIRYRTAIYVHITQGVISTTKATGRFWLKAMPDNEWHDVTIGLHHYLNENTKEANRNEDAWPEEGEFGQITLRMKIMPCFSPIHTYLRSYNQDMIGADPFYNDMLRHKAQKWIKEQNKKDDDEKDDIITLDYDLQAAVEAEKSRVSQEENSDNSCSEDEEDRLRRSSDISSEYGDESSDNDLQDGEEIVHEMDDTEFQDEMIEQRKSRKISRHKVLRKLAWSVDQFKHKVDVLKGGFNSETRASRSVAKEV